MNSSNGLRRRKPLTVDPTDQAIVADAENFLDDDSAASGEVKTAIVSADVLDRSFRRAVAGTALVWAFLCLMAVVLTPSESFKSQESEGASLALGAASLIMTVSVVTRGLSLLFADPEHGKQLQKGGLGDAPPPSVVGSQISGAALVGFFVQACSAITNGTMAFFATPTITDPVTGMEVCLLRWCEWAPLSFLMALLTASMDANSANGGLRRALQFALCQGISTLCGLLFPLLKFRPLWWATMVVSILLHAMLYPFLSSKMRSLWSLSDKLAYSATEMERRDRVRMAAQLVQLVTVAWLTLILFYFLAWVLEVSQTTNAMMECSVEVLSKHLYLNFLLDAHHRIFDPSRKAERSLAEFGHLMSHVSERRCSFTLSDDESSCDESTGEISPTQEQVTQEPDATDDVVNSIRQLDLGRYFKPDNVPSSIEMPSNQELEQKPAPEKLDDITVVCSDFVDSLTMCVPLSVKEVDDLISRLYGKFEDLCKKYDVKKIDIIGDAFFGLCVSSKHAARTALFALDAVSAANEVPVCPSRPEEGTVSVRFGIASGSVVSTQVGNGTHRRILYGDAVEAASRMESTSMPDRIQCTEETAELLRQQCPRLEIESRGEIEVRRKEQLETYLINRPRDVAELSSLLQ